MVNDAAIDVHANPQPSTLNPQPSTLNPQPSTLNPQPSTLNHQPSPLNWQASSINPSLSEQRKRSTRVPWRSASTLNSQTAEELSDPRGTRATFFFRPQRNPGHSILRPQRNPGHVALGLQVRPSRQPSHVRFRAKREQLKRCQRLLPESQGQTLVVTVLCVQCTSYVCNVT